MPRGQVFRHEVVTQSTVEVPKSLVASARRYSGPGAESIKKSVRRQRSNLWQNDVWDFYDTVPEFRAACSWVGNLVSKAVLEVVQAGKPTTNQHALDALESLFNGPEGQGEMLRLLGLNFTTAGEAWVIGTPSKSGDGDDWEVIAGIEVTTSGDGVNTVVQIEGEAQPPGTLALRLWKAHPRKSNDSDCPARALIPVLAEITALTQVVAAQAASRLTSAGILWVPSEMDMPTMPITVNQGEDSQVVDGAQALTELLKSVASQAIADRSSAAANVPIIVAAPGEFLEKVQKTEFWSGFDAAAKDLRDEAVRRIGIGMDMPPEALTGTADINHWGSWQIEEAAIKVHTEPLLGIIVSSLTTGYLIPYLQSQGVEDAESYSFKANTAALRLRPNRSKEAIELHDRGALNRRTLLVENGFDPEVDLMDDTEYKMWLLQKLADGSSTPGQVAAAYALLGVDGIPGDEAEVELQEVREARPTRSLERHPVQAEPNPEDSEARGVQASAAQQPYIIDGLVMASEQMVFRALERAGNRIRSKTGTKIAAEAADVYLSVPTLSSTECEALLEDAWTRVDRFAYPGVSAGKLRDALNEYTLMLLRSQKSMTRSSLSKHLAFELADEAA